MWFFSSIAKNYIGNSVEWAPRVSLNPNASIDHISTSRMPGVREVMDGVDIRITADSCGHTNNNRP